MRALSWLMALVVVLGSARPALAGELDDVERASGAERERSSDRDHSNDDNASRGHDDGRPSWSSGGGGGGGGGGSRGGSGRSASSSTGGDNSLGLAVAYVLVLPFIVPRIFDKKCVRGYAAYPDKNGFLRNAAWDEQCTGDGVSVLNPTPSTSNVVRKVAGNVGLEGAYGLGGLAGGTVSGQALLPYRLDLSVRLQMLADVTERPVEQAILSNTSLGVRFGQNERLAVRCGAGLRTFFLNERRLGPDFFYAISVFGQHGMRWEFEAHAGALSHAFAGELRATLGIMLGKTELYGGYNYFHVRGAGIGATLQGPVLGLRVWL